MDSEQLRREKCVPLITPKRGTEIGFDHQDLIKDDAIWKEMEKAVADKHRRQKTKPIDYGNSNDIRKQLTKKYRRYYDLWKQFYLLQAFLAIMGLSLALLNWEVNFQTRIDEGLQIVAADQSKNFLEMIVVLTSGLAIIATLIKQYCASVWYEYRSPRAFSLNLLEQENIAKGKREKILIISKANWGFIKATFTSQLLWTDLIILCLIPYPTMNKYVPASFITMTVNWVDNTGAFTAHTHKYATNYLTSDLMLTLMFSRFFILGGAIIQQVTDIDFQGKRVCLEHKLQPDLFLLFRSLMTNSPFMSLGGLFFASITFFSFVVQVFERPYYGFNLDPPQLDFSTFGSAAYWVIITMTSIGYGDVYPSTQMGRFVACLCAMWGGFMMSLVVAVISMALFLGENDQKIVDTYKEQKQAADVIIAGLQYNRVNGRRNRAIEFVFSHKKERWNLNSESNGEFLPKEMDNDAEEQKAMDNCPTLLQKIAHKNLLWKKVDICKAFRTGDSIANGSQTDQMAKQITTLTKNVTELNAKLSFFASAFYKQQTLSLQDADELDVKEQQIFIDKFTKLSQKQMNHTLEVMQSEKMILKNAGVLGSLNTLKMEHDVDYANFTDVILRSKTLKSEK